MDFLCFNIKEENFAIQIELVYKIVAEYELTQFFNTEQTPIYLITCLDKLIPIYGLHNNYNTDNKIILIFHIERIFGILVDNVTEIVRNEIPFGCKLVSVEDIERMVLGTTLELNGVELF